mmetsp:Transcript_813/g.2481  ORF Transcript_813/g.2481 Transcript_813/m.2481 type:complete len:261 (-) Transcript_813:461-1243(-)
MNTSTAHSPPRHVSTNVRLSTESASSRAPSSRITASSVSSRDPDRRSTAVEPDAPGGTGTCQGRGASSFQTRPSHVSAKCPEGVRATISPGTACRRKSNSPNHSPSDSLVESLVESPSGSGHGLGRSSTVRRRRLMSCTGPSVSGALARAVYRARSRWGSSPIQCARSARLVPLMRRRRLGGMADRTRRCSSTGKPAQPSSVGGPRGPCRLHAAAASVAGRAMHPCGAAALVHGADMTVSAKRPGSTGWRCHDPPTCGGC